MVRSSQSVQHGRGAAAVMRQHGRVSCKATWCLCLDSEQPKQLFFTPYCSICSTGQHPLPDPVLAQQQQHVGGAVAGAALEKVAGVAAGFDVAVRCAELLYLLVFC